MIASFSYYILGKYFITTSMVIKIKASEILVEYYDPDDDELGKAHMDDSRRPRLTLIHLQKLRKARDMEKYEKAQQLDFIPDMYGQSAEPGSM